MSGSIVAGAVAEMARLSRTQRVYGLLDRAIARASRLAGVEGVTLYVWPNACGGWIIGQGRNEHGYCVQCRPGQEPRLLDRNGNERAWRIVR